MNKRLRAIIQKAVGEERFFRLFSVAKRRAMLAFQKDHTFFLFRQSLPPEGAVLDVGANTGILTVMLAENAPARRVHAFEPVPINLRALYWMQQRFGLKNVTVHECALSDAPGHCTMVVPRLHGVHFPALSYIVHDVVLVHHEGPRFDVTVRTLDQVEALRTQRIAGIKIDVENAEYLVLSGARVLIQRERPLIYCEVWHNENRPRVFELMRELGYAIMTGEKKQLVPFDPGLHRTGNFFFVPKAGHCRATVGAEQNP